MFRRLLFGGVSIVPFKGSKMMTSNVGDIGLKTGQIQIIFGPMFSGKTTELIRRMRRFNIANYDCLLIKYAKDIRYDIDSAATHDGQLLKAVAAMSLEDLRARAEKAEVIGIDEGQFFPDIVEFAEEMANKNKTVIVAALDGTFQKKGFGNILNLVPIAESIVKLTAVCMVCFQEAAFTKRMTKETEVEVIGGTDKYIAACRNCHAMALDATDFCSPKKSPVKNSSAAHMSPIKYSPMSKARKIASAGNSN